VRDSLSFFAGLITTQPTPAAFAAYLARSTSRTAICRLICHRDDGRLLGAINVSEIVRGNFWSGYVGYYVGRRHAGQGYMTEALQLMLRVAFREEGLHRLEANIQPDNAASIALVRRAGFTREGYSRRYLRVANRWRDHERWALLADDWVPSRSSRPRRADAKGRTR
jgi:ribosomal-protein-alanine N-acetyltransferase